MSSNPLVVLAGAVVAGSVGLFIWSQNSSEGKKRASKKSKSFFDFDFNDDENKNDDSDTDSESESENDTNPFTRKPGTHAARQQRRRRAHRRADTPTCTFECDVP